MMNLPEPHHSHELAANAALAAISAKYNAIMIDDERAYWLLIVGECAARADLYSRGAERYEVMVGAVFPGVRS